MNQFYSWCLVIFLSVVWLVILPLVFNVAKSQDKYRVSSTIGIRTTNAVNSFENWKLAQSSAARYAVVCGTIQLILSATLLWLNLFSENLFPIIAASIFIVLMILLVYLVEQQLKKC